MNAQSRVTSRCDVAYSGRENLYQFLPVLLRGMLPLFSIMTLWIHNQIKLINKIKFRISHTYTQPNSHTENPDIL